MMWERLNRVFVILFLLAASASGAEAPFSDAEFEMTTDPTAMVLFVRIQGSMHPSFHSLSLYGDGRLVLKRGVGDHVEAEVESQLSFEEMRRLVSLATSHGLAEWDGMAFKAKTLELNGGKLLPVPEDAARLRILLSLTEYRRGDLHFKDHQRQIELYAPYQVDRFHPGIREVTGMVALVEEITGRLALAEEKP